MEPLLLLVMLVGVTMIVYGYFKSRPDPEPSYTCARCGRRVNPADHGGGVYYLYSELLCKDCFNEVVKIHGN